MSLQSKLDDKLLTDLAAKLWDHLKNAPALCQSQSKTICAKLLVPPERRAQLQALLDAGEMDSHRYGNTGSDQGEHPIHGVQSSQLLRIYPAEALEKIVALGLHIPKVYSRDITLKWSIHDSRSSPLRAGTYRRQHWLFQCVCGSDHTIGPTPTSTRQMSFQNLRYNAFAKVTATFFVSSPTGVPYLLLHKIYLY